MGHPLSQAANLGSNEVCEETRLREGPDGALGWSEARFRDGARGDGDGTSLWKSGVSILKFVCKDEIKLLEKETERD